MKINWILIAFLVFGSWVLKAQVADSSAIKRAIYDSLYEKASNAIRTGNFEEGKRLTRQAAEACTFAYGKESLPYAYCMATLASVYYYLRQLDSTLFWQDSAMAIILRVESYNSLTAAYLYADRCSVYGEMSNYPEAEKNGLEAIRIFQSNNHPHEAIPLNWLGATYAEQGLHERADSMFKRALQIILNHDGKDHHDYFQTLRNMANNYADMDELEKSLVCYLELKEHSKKEIGYSTLLNNYGAICMELGLWEEAQSAFEEAIEINQKQYPQGNPNTFSPLINMAELYEIQKQYNKADSIYASLWSAGDKSFEKNHLERGKILMHWGEIRLQMKQYTIADSMIRRAMAYISSNIGEQNVSYIDCLLNLAKINHRIRQLDSATFYYQRSLELIESASGKRSQRYAHTCADFAWFLERNGQIDKATIMYEEERTFMRDWITRLFSVLSENRKSRFFSKNENYFEGLNSFYFNFQTDGINAAAKLFDDCLLLKNAQLESENTTRNIILKNGDSILIHSYDYLQGLNKLLSMSKMNPNNNEVKKWEDQSDSVAAEIAIRSGSFKSDSQKVEWKKVQNTLNEHEAAIEFIRFHYRKNDWTDSILYCALVLRAEYEAPRIIFLFEEKQLDTLLLHKTTDSEQYVGLVYRNPKLYKLIWEPFDSLLDGVTRIYYSPSGLLHRVSLPAIAERADGPLLADRYSLQYVSSTRELVVGKEKLYGKDIQTGLVYGGIRYETDSIKMAGSLSKLDADFKKWSPDTVALPKMSTAHTDTLLQSWTSILHRGSDERADPRYLPGSLREMEKTGRLFKSKSIRTMTLSEYEASEESFKRLGEDFPSPDVIHVSTHGFFFPDPVRRKEDADKPILFAGNPLFRSGLHFAGSIQAWRKNAPLKGFDDGILYAYEVSHLNLSNTKLVVLSACETGLGDIRGSEGVYGLQRAFRLAGAQHILMSLWKISDDATVDFMETFYLNWLSGKETDIREAFARTQKEMRKKYKDPYYWAAFVLI